MAERGSIEQRLLQRIFVGLEEFQFQTRQLVDNPSKEQILELVKQLVEEKSPTEFARMNVAKLLMDRMK